MRNEQLKKRTQGFSLIELLCSVALLMIVGGAAMYALVIYQKTYSSNSVRQDLQSSVRSATELLQQEIGQAGAFTGLGGVTTPISITTNIASGSTAVAFPAAVAPNMWVGEKLQVDVNSSLAETVSVTARSGNNVTATFANSHTGSVASPIIISLAGIFPNGIIPGTGSTAGTTAATQLNIIGDVNNDGNLYYVTYSCVQLSTPPTYGTLTRTITQLPASTLTTTATTSDTLVQNVVPNPDGSGCFTYPTAITPGSFTNVYSSVGVTLTTQASTPDAQTGANCPTNSNPTNSGCYAAFTNSFLNLSPRNIIYGVNLATAGSNNLLQTLPPSTYYP